MVVNCLFFTCILFLLELGCIGCSVSGMWRFKHKQWVDLRRFVG